MKSSIVVFSLGTCFLLFIFFSQNTEKSFPPNTLDDKIKVTSLSSSIPILNREPTFFSEASPVDIVPHIVLPNIKVASALVLDLNQRKSVLEFQPEKRWPIASITKLMAAIIAAEAIGFQKTITFNNEDILTEGSAGDFRQGEIFTVGDLVKAMLTVSSNDAAEALARFYGYRQFIDLMQEKARDLGMNETTFFDSTGLSSLNQSTTKDIAQLSIYILKSYPDFFYTSTEKETWISELNAGLKKKLKNINQFSGRDDFRGGKTGYIDEAGGNLVSLFTYNGHNLLIIIFGAEDRFLETEKLYEWAKTVLR